MAILPNPKFRSVQMKIDKGVSLQWLLQLYFKMASVMPFFHTIKKKHPVLK